MQEAPKKIWFFSYGASGPSITNTLWTLSTGLGIDECYTLTQRDLKYTLIHTPKRTTVIGMKHLFKILERKTGIKGSPVFGYDEICCGDGVWEHPGMKLMIEHMNNKSPAFDHWLQHGDLDTYKRGLLTKFMVSNNLAEMSKIQLLHYIQDYKVKTDSKIHEMEQEYRDMEAEIFRLRDKVKAQKSEIRLLRTDNAMFNTLLSKPSHNP